MSWERIGEPKLDQPTPSEAAVLGARAAIPLGYARTTAFTCELPEGPPVLRLLTLGERVLAVRAPDARRRQSVELIDAEGRWRRTIAGLHGDWAVDARHAMLLGRSPDAELCAWSLDEPERRAILVFNRLNGRELDTLRFVDDSFVALTRPTQRLGGPPSDVLVDVVRVPSYEDVSRWRSLRSRIRVAERIAEGIDRVVLGFDPAGLILVHERELWWGDWTLAERARLELGPELLPLQIAPRSDGSSWMLVEREGRTELWQVVVGRCVEAFVISDKLVDAGPLLVAPDDAVVLVGSSEVASFDADGQPRWSFARSGAATGLIDEQGVALYSDGGALISTGPGGGRATVWLAPEGITRLGPLAATPSGLRVGAGRSVFGLR